MTHHVNCVFFWSGRIHIYLRYITFPLVISPMKVAYFVMINLIQSKPDIIREVNARKKSKDEKVILILRILNQVHKHNAALFILGKLLFPIFLSEIHLKKWRWENDAQRLALYSDMNSSQACRLVGHSSARDSVSKEQEAYPIRLYVWRREH